MTLRSEKPAEDSLFFSGAWQSKDGYLTRSDLAKLDGYKLIESEIVPKAGKAQLGVIPLKSLINLLGLQSHGDGLVLECTDRWESFMEISYIEEKNPLLLLYYNNESPKDGNWPWFGGNIEPLEPFYVFIDGQLDSYPESPKFGMISATQMSGIRAVNTEERYAPYFAPPMDQLSKIARSGRQIFLQRCSTCHLGPGSVGGNVAERPFIILQTHAQYNEAYLRSVIVDPKTVYPDTIMPRHKDFGDTELDAITAYLKETAVLKTP
ncbi:MAG: c-type cytochrome [Verrucomicrobiota bacterium]